MRIHNLYEDEQGESHWRDIEVEWTQTTATGRLASLIPVSGLIFRETRADYDLDWHPAPRRQFILCMAGVVEIELGNGEKRRFGPGDVYLADDLTGEGHIHREIEGPLIHAWVHLPPELDLSPWRK